MSALYQRVSPLALASILAGCAPLVSYDGFRGGDGDLDANGDDAGAEASSGDARSDGGDDACQAVIPGTYCGRALPGYSGGTQDLVRCLGNATTGSVTKCAAGCSSMPDGRQDLCNPCAGKADGTYCVHELAVDYSGNDVIVTCASNETRSAALCPLVCTSSACR